VSELGRESSRRVQESMRCLQSVSCRFTGRQLGGDEAADPGQNNWQEIRRMVTAMYEELSQVLERLPVPECSAEPKSREPSEQYVGPS
jgi:hypothetical protein